MIHNGIAALVHAAGYAPRSPLPASIKLHAQVEPGLAEEHLRMRGWCVTNITRGPWHNGSSPVWTFTIR